MEEKAQTNAVKNNLWLLADVFKPSLQILLPYSGFAPLWRGIKVAHPHTHIGSGQLTHVLYLQRTYMCTHPHVHRHTLISNILIEREE